MRNNIKTVSVAIGVPNANCYPDAFLKLPLAPLKSKYIYSGNKELYILKTAQLPQPPKLYTLALPVGFFAVLKTQ